MRLNDHVRSFCQPRCSPDSQPKLVCWLTWTPESHTDIGTRDRTYSQPSIRRSSICFTEHVWPKQTETKMFCCKIAERKSTEQCRDPKGLANFLIFFQLWCTWLIECNDCQKEHKAVFYGLVNIGYQNLWCMSVLLEWPDSYVLVNHTKSWYTRCKQSNSRFSNAGECNVNRLKMLFIMRRLSGWIQFQLV